MGAAAGIIPRGARATHPLDLHLTLRFLGPMSAEALAGAERAADMLAAGPVPVRIDRVGHFARSRVIWCGPASPSPDLLHLADRLEQALQDQGVAPETRPFRPHITLARQVGHPPPRAAVHWRDPVEWTARELTLAAGRQGQVPRYVLRRRWPLSDLAGEPPCPPV